MTSEDPRRKLIAEAMEARDGKEWSWADTQVYWPTGGKMVKYVASADRANARSIALSHNALPDAVELIDELTATNRDLHRRAQQGESRGRKELGDELWGLGKEQRRPNLLRAAPDLGVPFKGRSMREIEIDVIKHIAEQAKELERLVHLVAEVERRSAVAGRVVYEVRREMAND